MADRLILGRILLNLKERQVFQMELKVQCWAICLILRLSCCFFLHMKKGFGQLWMEFVLWLSVIELHAMCLMLCASGSFKLGCYRAKIGLRRRVICSCQNCFFDDKCFRQVLFIVGVVVLLQEHVESLSVCECISCGGVLFGDESEF